MKITRLIIGIVFLVGLTSCSPPQYTNDKEIEKAIEGLYSATGMEDVAQVERCETKLKKLHEEGKFSADVWKYLQEVIQQAKAGKWTNARDKCYKLIKGQKGT